MQCGGVKVTKERARALRTMVGMYGRRASKLEAELSARRRALEEKQAQAEEARQQREQCEKDEWSAKIECEDLMTRPFSAADVVSMNLHVQSLGTLVKQAGKAVEEAARFVAYQEKTVREAQSDLSHNAQNIETFDAEVKKIALARELEVEELTEEEAAEGFVARMIASRNAAKRSA